MSLCLFLSLSTATNISEHWFCKSILPPADDNYSNPITCKDESNKFTLQDDYVYVVAKLSNLIEGDEVIVNIIDPNDQLVTEYSTTVAESIDTAYDFTSMKINGENRALGTYKVNVSIKGTQVLTDNFMIVDPPIPKCSDHGYYCCPAGKICGSPKESECESGTCCASEADCKSGALSTLSRTLITNCEDTGLNECNRVVKLYEYSVHGSLQPEQVVEIEYRGMDIDCFKKDDIKIAYYDDSQGKWVERPTASKLLANDVYLAQAYIRYVGYVALLRTKSCVPLTCTSGGYKTKPISSIVMVNEPITFEICGMTSQCEAIKDGVCDKNCPQNMDPDCSKVNCTSEAGDCCVVSYDKKCDKDCAPYTDPDCCRKADGFCCVAGEDRSDSAGCDKNCNTGSSACTGCTPSAGDCCKADSDGICDPDCPKLGNGVGYLDTDCCAQNSVPVTNNKGDCCDATRDGVCDCDCIKGLDIDCILNYDGLCH